MDNGRITELRARANCDAIEPVRWDAPPNATEMCGMNLNANPGAAAPGEGLVVHFLEVA
jgi:hypothetical protein